MRKIISFALSFILLTGIFSFTANKAAKKMKFILKCYESSVMAGGMYAATMNQLDNAGYIIYEAVPPTQSGSGWCYMISYDVNPTNTKPARGK